MIATKHPRRSASLIEAGDTHVFNGLRNDATMETDEASGTMATRTTAAKGRRRPTDAAGRFSPPMGTAGSLTI